MNRTNSCIAPILLLLGGCLSCAQLPLEEIDRGRLNSAMMNFTTYSELDTTSPHTALRSTGGTSNNGCSVCAH